ncbi:MAG TPA: MBL fold metallo-hydrolase [Bacteroidales bacterium]|nr:MBL fold metallo-hydrolase [Bacteroidales bacterium]
MLTIKTFQFNAFGVNTYVLANQNNECVIIDPGCYTPAEQKSFDVFLETSKLKIEKLLITHCHVDHILGVAHLEDKFGVGAWIHPAGKEFLRASVGYASVFGFDLKRIITPAGYINEGEQISLCSDTIDILYTPGHAEGSVCFVNHAQKIVFSGDVLFNDGIGRTDLPTGDYDLLISSIKNKLMTLDDDYTVYPGHGPATTIRNEKKNNMFLK